MGLSFYYTPTRVTFGPGAENNAGNELKKEGAAKVLIHYGSQRIVKNGLLENITRQLDENGISYMTLGGVVPNPRLSLVREGIRMVKENGIDFILAVGGGSVIDSAKCIGYGSVYDGDVWDFYSQKAVPRKTLPVGCILTMAAAGSEMSDSSVITNEEGGLKRGCNSDVCRLRFALLNPQMTYSLPPFQTSCAVVDIMMHTMERYFTSGVSLPLTDNLAFSLLNSVKDAGYRVLEKPDDYDARATIMWASSLSHNGLMALGNDTKGDWASHQIEHELSGMFDIAHGAGLAVIWPAWAKYNIDINPMRIAKLGYNVFSVIPSDDVKADAQKTIENVESFYKSINMPVRVSDMGITLSDSDIDTLAEKCTFFGKRKVGAFRPLAKEDIMAIYRLAR